MQPYIDLKGSSVSFFRIYILFWNTQQHQVLPMLAFPCAILYTFSPKVGCVCLTRTDTSIYTIISRIATAYVRKTMAMYYASFGEQFLFFFNHNHLITHYLCQPAQVPFLCSGSSVPFFISDHVYGFI